MGNRYTDTFIYALEGEGALRCLHRRSFDTLADAYRVTVRIREREYMLLDLLDDSVETEGEPLPEPGLDAWATVFSPNVSSQVAQVFALAGVNPAETKKIVWVQVDSVPAGICGFRGGVLSPAGSWELAEQDAAVRDDPEDFALDTAHWLLEKQEEAT